MNAVGDRIAIGSPYGDYLQWVQPPIIEIIFDPRYWFKPRPIDPSDYELRRNTGLVRVYKLNTSNIWEPLGFDIRGKADEVNSGWSVSMNAVGDRVAIGSPNRHIFDDKGDILYINDEYLYYVGLVRVYTYDTSNGWTQLSNDMEGNVAGEKLGSSVSMNAVGDRVAIGCPGGIVFGRVRVYHFINGYWGILSDIINQYGLFGKYFGWSVSMNAVGDRVVIGAPESDLITPWVFSYRGCALVYELKSTGWVKIGGINGVTNVDRCGYSVSINAVGDRVAIGCPSSSNLGITRLYKFITPLYWEQLGGDIFGNVPRDKFGWSVSINAVGDRVAIGAINHHGVNGVNSGLVRVYQLNTSNVFEKFGNDIDGEATGDLFGSSVSMNAIGDRIGIGAPNNDNIYGQDFGKVQVFYPRLSLFFGDKYIFFEDLF